MDLKDKIKKSIKDDLDKIEEELKKNLNSPFKITQEIASFALLGGGKKLRPILFLLSARLCENTNQDIFKFSTIFEYLHAASLVHDDVIDDSDLRRQKETTKKKYGNQLAVLTGDYLFARAIEMAAESKNIKFVQTVTKITQDLVQGELLQLESTGNIDLSYEKYLKIIECKTASLTSGACKSAALISDVSMEKQNALYNYGLNLGIAFQIADDLLDYQGDQEKLGKKQGADYKEDKITLPIILSLSKSNSNEKAEFEKLFKTKNKENFDLILNIIKEKNALEESFKIAQDAALDAKESLKVFNASKNKEILESLADFAILRKS